MKRKSGVLMHISSLPGEYSCGSFGKSARAFVDFLSESGFSYWQVLPFCLPDNFRSPYNSYSAFSVNPDFIDLEALYEVGLLTDKELESARQQTPYLCEFDRLKNERFALLSKAAERFGGEKVYKDFFKSHPHTEKFCRFMAIKANNGGKPFWEWETNEEDKAVLGTWKFICYIFMHQWKQLKGYANEKGISIIGDIPIYISADSSDLWENPKQFLVDERCRPTAVAGVPPDYFSEDGQLWGNPLYDWAKMKEDGFAWWKDRMSFMCELFDCVRIDHFRGLESFYSCPPNAENARVGKWRKGPGMALIKALREACGGKDLIAEDLGVQTKQVEKLVKDSGCPGMKVLQFAFSPEMDSPHLPHNYGKNCIAYTGTHDNNTLLGYFWDMDPELRRTALAYCGFEKDHWDCKEAYYSVIRTMLQSPADTVIFPLQDLLCYGADTRMNVPGVKEGNWGWRLTQAQIDSLDRGRLHFLNKLYDRIPKEEKPDAEEK